MGDLKTMAEQSPQQKSAGAVNGISGAANEAALLSLMERTGFSMIQENGQRKYGGPPPKWEGPAPPRGCEVFVGKIPRDCYEDELVPVFEKIGNIYELRLMMDFSGANRGYCFVMFTSRDDAKRAVREINNYEIRKGRFLGVCLSVDNCRLFVGGIPKNKQRDEILSEMTKVTEGVVDVIVYPSATDKTKNRGFAFVEYESHRSAAMARRKLIPGRIQLWGHQIAVDWAEPEQEVDEDIMSKVKILYVRNLMLSTTEETIEQEFNKAAGKDGAVERVKKIRDYAFVHYKEREDALRAMVALNNTKCTAQDGTEYTGSMLEGSMIEVVLAKPVDKNDYVRYTRGGSVTAGRGTIPAGLYPGFDAAAFPGSALYAGAQVSSASTPGFPNRSHLGARPGTSSSARGRGRGAAGSRGAGGARGGYSYMRGYGKRPFPGDERLYDILPGMELTPTNPITLKPQNVKSPTQLLEELCQKNGWGTPVYQLHSAMGRDGSGDIQLFLYKIQIPALAGSNGFQPNKLCRTIDEAKNFAAEHVLVQLGVPVERSSSSESLTPPPAATQLVPAASPPVSNPYQGRPLSHGPTPFIATNGATAAGDLVYSTSAVPLVSSVSSPLMGPAAKIQTDTLGIRALKNGKAGYPTAAPYQMGFQQY